MSTLDDYLAGQGVAASAEPGVFFVETNQSWSHFAKCALEGPEAALLRILQCFISLGSRQVFLESTATHWLITGLEPMGALFRDSVTAPSDKLLLDGRNSPEKYLFQALCCLERLESLAVLWVHWDGSRVADDVWTLRGELGTDTLHSPKAARLGGVWTLNVEFRKAPELPTEDLGFKTVCSPAAIFRGGRMVNTFTTGFPRALLGTGLSLLEYHCYGSGDRGRLGLRPSGPATVSRGPDLGWPQAWSRATALTRVLSYGRLHSVADSYNVGGERVLLGNCLVLIGARREGPTRAWPVQGGITLQGLAVHWDLPAVDVVFCAHGLPVDPSQFCLERGEDLQFRLREVHGIVRDALHLARHLSSVANIIQLRPANLIQKTLFTVAGAWAGWHGQEAAWGVAAGCLGGLGLDSAIRQLRVHWAARRVLGRNEQSATPPDCQPSWENPPFHSAAVPTESLPSAPPDTQLQTRSMDETLRLAAEALKGSPPSTRCCCAVTRKIIEVWLEEALQKQRALLACSTDVLYPKAYAFYVDLPGCNGRFHSAQDLPSILLGGWQAPCSFEFGVAGIVDGRTIVRVRPEALRSNVCGCGPGIFKVSRWSLPGCYFGAIPTFADLARSGEDLARKCGRPA